jgi:acyl-CoA hydrolase
MVKEKSEFVGLLMPVSLRNKIKLLAAIEYDGNESMTIKVILKKHFARKDKQA